MIAIIDYDAGNLRSVEKALLSLGEDVIVTREREKIYDASKVILPGVGAFGDCMNKLKDYDLIEVIKSTVDSGKPFLGICLGLQLLYESSEESAGTEGLSILEGNIIRIPDKEGIKVPHMGWNSIDIASDKKLFKGIKDQSYVYFVHSYYLDAKNKNEVAATCHYSTTIDASVEKDNVFACQFHPEKSGEVGLKILKNFAELNL